MLKTNVTRSEAIDLFVALGFANAEEWKMTRMLGKIKALPDTPNIDNKLKKHKKLEILCKKLVAAVEGGDEINITKGKKGTKVSKKSAKPKKDVKGTKEKKGTKAKKGTKTSAATKSGKGTKKDSKKKKTTRGEVDAFNSRLGTSGSAINGVFLKAPKKIHTSASITKELDLKLSRVQAHLYHLSRKNSYIVAKKDGYVKA